jgi:hypothetical protein
VRRKVLAVAGEGHVHKVLLVSQPAEGGGQRVVVVGPAEAARGEGHKWEQRSNKKLKLEHSNVNL